MQQELVQWLIGGMGGIAIVLLGAIWAETRRNSDKLQEICIKFAATDNRVDTHEKYFEKIPCLNGMVCLYKKE
jgi:hypothetical protein